MRSGIRLILLLVLAVALRGFAAPAFAVPATAPEQSAVCHEAGDHSAPVAHAYHESDDRACTIACDLAAAPALAGPLQLPAGEAPAALIATRPVLALSAPPPPEDPPPIR